MQEKVNLLNGYP